jgi:hypothetical protein
MFGIGLTPVMPLGVRVIGLLQAAIGLDFFATRVRAAH